MNHSRSLLILLLFGFTPIAVEAASPTPDQAEFFEKKIRPVLVEHCWSCHSAKATKLKGGLRVDGRAHLLAGGDNGPALVPGQPEKSRLIEAIGYRNVQLQMPPKSKLPDAVVADLTAWVKMGAPWPGDVETKVAAGDSFDLAARQRSHWSWKPVQLPRIPKVADGDWPIAPSDSFLLEKLESKGISPARPAEPHELLRRIYFDLTGLPPAPEIIVAFEREYATNANAALERVVDRLLATPQFGERWGRHWLDLVRYAESRGHEFEPNIPNAWQYRDYIIRAFNADVPYNQLVVEHVAGDLLTKPRLHPKEGFNESILGTGFWFLGEEVHSPVDIRGDEADRYDNRIDVLSKAFLGLTVACARCHDHKFDAISTRDYYALYGFIRSSNYRLARFDSMEQNRKVAVELSALRTKQRSELSRILAESAGPAVGELAAYLSAAGRLLPSANNEAVRKLAGERKLDAQRLTLWVEHLRKAAGNTHDLFHAFARIATDANGGKQLLGEWARGRAAPAANIVVDYAAPDTPWLPDGPTFGAGPARPGDLRLSDQGEQPIARVLDTAAAEVDPFWRDLKVAAGAQLDPGALGYDRAGKTIRTRTFALDGDKLFYLVKGTGKAYASIDGHVVIAGPLHKALVMSINTSGQWRWVAQNLGAYRGHRLHVEFTAESPDFAIAQVSTGETPTPVPSSTPDWLIGAVKEGKTSEDLAKAYQKQFQKTIDCLKSDSIAASADARELAKVADWAVHNPALLSIDSRALRRTAEPLLAAEKDLRSRVKWDSRLAPAIQDGTGENEHVFIRGSHKAPGAVTPRRFLEAIVGGTGIESPGSGRLELARQMTDPKVNPYISRVIVNRIWHHLFGRGIVASTDNFGELGERPTHPELLDYLAARFVEDGWSIKKLIRQLMLSRAYQMSSQPDEKADAADPENLLLHRARLRRLQGEAIRDSLLFVSGRLDATMFGPSIPIHLTPFLDGRGRPQSGPVDGNGRRSIYLAVRRNFLSPFMLAFDTPSPFSTVGRRTVSNVPAQALILMNDPFVHQMAELWGKRIAAAPGSVKDRVEQMYLQAFARRPTAVEQADCAQFVGAASDAKRWAELAHVLTNVKEFIFVN